jgi:hypothetical protein
LVIVLSVLFFWSLCCLSFSFGFCFDRQYNDQKKRTDNTMTKRRGQTIQ